MSRPVNSLVEISPDLIKQNPSNPRLIFHEEEMTELLESIRTVGIKVPLTVYTDEPYTIIDGERRWRCAKRLNLKTVPVIVQPKPTPLENLLMMFNIHKVRVDWDIMPTAIKLGEVREMLAEAGQSAGAKDLAGITGLPLATVRRHLELLSLPERYKTMLIEEANKPRAKQRIKADLFFEIYQSLHVIENYVPDVFLEVTDEQYIDAMVNKYLDKVVVSVTSYRELRKIARAELAGVGSAEAKEAIIKLVKKKNYSIDQAYNDTVQAAYDKRDLVSKLSGITERLTHYRVSARLDSTVRETLLSLRNEINLLLEQ